MTLKKTHKQPANQTKESANTNASPDRKTLLEETLRRRIISMELPPGGVIDELSLSKEFGLSRPPVRELMRELAAEGYIELEANRPARVSAMNYQSMRSFFQAAPLIYIATTQLAATHATKADIEALQAIQNKFKDAMQRNDTIERVHYNDLFHFEIGKIARNAYLMPSLRRLLIDHARLGKTFYRSPSTEDMRNDMEKAVQQHDQIINAIANHDTEAAGELIREHWELSRRRMAEYVMPDGVDIPLSF